MELVYFWIEKFGDKNNQDINFNQNYTFKVEKQDEKYFLKMEENNNKIPDNYFGEKISNISCIIGNNGSGKTSLIKEILRSKDYQYSLKMSTAKYISVFKENNKLKIKSNLGKERINIIFFNVSYEYDKSKCNESNIKNNIIIDSIRDDYIGIKYIYFTNDFKPMNESFIANVYDISLKNRLTSISLSNEKLNTVTGLDFIATLYNENMEDIAIFIIEHGDNFIEKIPYCDLKNKLLKIKDEGIIIYETGKQFHKDKIDDTYEKIYNKINIKNSNFKNRSFIEKFILNAWIEISNSIFYRINEKESLEKYINYLIQRKDESLEKWFEKQLDNLIKSGELLSFTNSSKIKLLYNLIKDKCINKNTLEIPYKENKRLIEDIKELNKLINLLNFRFNDGFSSAEYILIYLLKEFFDLRSNIDLNGSVEGVVFFLEELESFLHPEWQRRLIELLKIIAENCPWLGDRKIQFILSSHTPFLVGDLPAGNVKRIEEFEIKDLTENPFGDNLLNIFKSQFNLESLFGEFTREKIKKYAKKLKENRQLLPEEKEEVKFLINNIEEPLIRSSLKELYEKTFSKEERIKFLEEEIKKLKEEKNAEVK